MATASGAGRRFVGDGVYDTKGEAPFPFAPSNINRRHQGKARSITPKSIYMTHDTCNTWYHEA